MSTSEMTDILKEKGFQPETNLTGEKTAYWRVNVAEEIFRVSFSDSMWVLYRDNERLDYGFKLTQLASKLEDDGLREYVHKPQSAKQ